MCKCYNFILRRIHVYYQAVLWTCGVIDYSVWICRNKINSDRIICGYLGFRNLLSKHNSRNENSFHFNDFSLLLPNKNYFHRADFWSQELSCSCFGWLSFWSLIESRVCIKPSSSSGRWELGRRWAEMWGGGLVRHKGRVELRLLP